MIGHRVPQGDVRGQAAGGIGQIDSGGDLVQIQERLHGLTQSRRCLTKSTRLGTCPAGALREPGRDRNCVAPANLGIACGGGVHFWDWADSGF
ncbi:hypothetical protein SMICM17S_12639 [Streptomyces microflavus]